MLLLELPLELLMEIYQYTRPADLAALAHSCRFSYSLLKDDLLTQTYGILKVFGPEGIAIVNRSDGSTFEPHNSSSRFLRTIKQFPHIAEFPRHVIVNWRKYCWCPPGVAMADCDCRSKEQYLLDGVAFEALLSQLPKTQSITFEGILAPMINFVIPNLARRSLQTDIPFPGALTSLSRLSLSFHIDDDHGFVDLQLLMWAALITSLKTLDLHKVSILKMDESYLIGDLKRWGSGSLTSNVTELNMNDCCCDTEDFRSFFRGLSSLQSLAITLDFDKDFTWEGTWFHDHISEKLLSSVKKSLQRLHLRADYGQPGSLVEFTSLRRVDISCAMTWNEEDDVVEPLVDILPPSIEEVRLIGKTADVISCEHARALFHRLPQLKPTQFPNLRKVVSTSPIPKDIAEACSAVGVRIIYNRRHCDRRQKKKIWPNFMLPVDQYDESM